MHTYVREGSHVHVRVHVLMNVCVYVGCICVCFSPSVVSNVEGR